MRADRRALSGLALPFFALSLFPISRSTASEHFGASGVEVLSQLTLSEFDDPPASQGNDIWGYVSPSGREYALMGLNNQTAFVEITDPRNPVLLGATLHTSTIWSDMATYQDHAYIVTDGVGRGMQIVDLSAIDEGTLTERPIYDGEVGLRFTLAHSVAINEDSGFLYLAGNRDDAGYQGLAILDLANPAAPVRVRNWSIGYLHDVHVITYHEGPYAGREIAFGFAGGAGLHIIDVTDKANIVDLATEVTYPGLEYCHQGWLSDDRRFLFIDDELDEGDRPDATSTTYVFDVQNLELPVYVGSFTNLVRATDHNLWVRGRFVYEANYTSGLRIYDISGVTTSSAAAVEVGYLDTHPNVTTDFAGAWGVFAGFPSGNVIVSDMQRGLYVLDPVVSRTAAFVRDEGWLGDELDSQGIAWGDVDADGDPDACVTTRLGSNRLLRNEGTTGFSDATFEGLAEAGDARGALFVDLDDDDDLDLHLVTADPTRPDRVFRNDAGAFVDVAAFPPDETGNGRSSAAADFDLDGDLDVFVTQFSHPNRLYRNDGGFTFVDVAPSFDLDDGAQSGGATWADLDGDRDPDLLVANLNQPNRVYRNTGTGFVDIGPTLPGGAADGRSLSVATGDIDNDGDLDVCFGGYLAPTVFLRNEGVSGFSDMSAETGIVLGTARTFTVSFVDVDRDTRLDLVVNDYDHGTRLFHQRPNGTFLETSGANFPDSSTPVGGASADVDGDGAPDWLTARAEGPPQLYRNVSLGAHWVDVELEASRGNRRGVGARVVVEAGGVSQVREVTAGHGYLSQSPTSALFGVGGALLITRIRVHWPGGGYTDVVDVPVDERVRISDEDFTPTDPETGGGPTAPRADRLLPGVPNPFNPRTTIAFDLASPAEATLVVFDPSGRALRTLWSARAATGRHEVVWDGRDDRGRGVASGVYYVRLSTPSHEETETLILSR
jgi:choice-of-anchor B domain-containing protein